MAPKIFKQAFAKDFQGISGECSAIEPDGGEVNRAINYEYSVGNSLRGRVGCQTSGTGFFALFAYNYTRTQDQYDLVYQVGAGAHPNQTPTLTTTKTAADGTSITKLIALNQQLWSLENMNITITQTNAGTYTWYSAVSGSNINFNILKNGASILSSSMGDGITSSTSIWSLLNTIDGLADLAVSRTTRGTCPPFAIVNGNQTTAFVANMSWGTSYSVTVANTPHNFYPGDIITFNLSTGIVGGVVLARTATTITYAGPQVTLVDGDILGYMGQAATSFPISTVSSETSGSLIISFPYWKLIPEGDSSSLVGAVSRNYGNIFKSAYNKWAAKTTGDFYAPPTAVNAEGCLYIAASSSAADFAGGFGSGTGAYANSLIKVDGRTAVRAGLAKPDITPTVVAAAGALTGTYKYKCFLRRYDSQNNITDGPVSTVKTVTYAANYGSIAVISNLNYLYASGFGHRMAYKYTSEAPAAPTNFFYVDDNSAAPGVNGFIQPGDRVFLTDTVAQKAGLWQFAFGVDPLGTLHKTVCTGYDGLSTPSSISVADASGYTIPNNSHINTGLTAVVLRTAAGGNQYYVLCEIPVDLIASTQSFFDNVTDTVLTAGEQYIEVPIGKEHDAPAACSLVCEHQGGLVIARNPFAPNMLAFSSADGLECFPLASNYFDVPSTQGSFITAIASDTTDRLAVFKERAYYDVQGDLDGGIFSINVRNEGDYGIVSQASLKRVGNALWGLSKNGWVVIQDGFLDPYKFKGVSSRLMNQSYQWGWTTAVNDYFNRQYICSIPQVTGEPVTYVIDYSRNQIITLERSYPTKIDPVGGMAMVGDTLYHLSSTSPYGVFRRLIRFNSNSPSGNGDGDSFIDNTNAISYILESQPINFGEPGQLKSPIRIRVWSVPNDYVIEGWVPFSALVETGASPLAQYVGSGGTNNTSSTITFSADTDVYRDVKLVKQKCHFYIVKFTTNTIRTAPFLTGYEIMFAENYEKEDFVK